VTTPTDLARVREQLASRYSIERELGRGGMGAVFLARDLKLDRLVALKVLPAEFATDVVLRDRFLRETRTTASFSHPNIVPVHAIEERDDILAYAMGFVEGESVAERVQRAGPLTVREIVRLLQDVGYALAYAHGRGVVHRDIKPDNIMLERATGRALLMDFGISRVMHSASAPSAGLTRVGEVVGTPEYMSPEQASGDAIDGRSDLYSLGLVAWFAATGATAMAAESTQKVIIKQLTESVPPLHSARADLPPALTAAVDKCLAKSPDDRFATAEALVEDVDNAQLAGPEIPLPIRLFTQEIGTMSLVVFFIALISWFAVRTANARFFYDAAAFVVVILFAVAWTRVLQTVQEARRLAEAGFTREVITRGMRAVVDEREQMRDALRANPATVRRRRITVAMAAGQLVVAAALARWAYGMRILSATGEITISRPGLIMIFSAVAMLGVALVLFARSPLRMPVGERLFRRIWLGPIGRGFLAFAARGVPRG
jgi:serine/threonine-protein kinase